jgi:hypothetical protein
MPGGGFYDRNRDPYPNTADTTDYSGSFITRDAPVDTGGYPDTGDTTDYSGSFITRDSPVDSGGLQSQNTTSGSGGTDPSQILADITNEEFAIYEEDFLPVEEQLIAEATDPQSGNKAAEQALADQQAGFARQKAIRDRGLGRTGTDISLGQSAKMSQLDALAGATGGVGAANLARRGQIAEDDATITNLVQAGQSLRGIALQGLGAASNMQSQRDAMGRANQAQAQQQFMSNVGAGAGIGGAIGYGASIGGPWGAAIGAGIGALVSIF